MYSESSHLLLLVELCSAIIPCFDNQHINSRCLGNFLVVDFELPRDQLVCCLLHFVSSWLMDSVD